MKSFVRAETKLMVAAAAVRNTLNYLLKGFLWRLKLEGLGREINSKNV